LVAVATPLEELEHARVPEPALDLGFRFDPIRHGVAAVESAPFGPEVRRLRDHLPALLVADLAFHCHHRLLQSFILTAILPTPAPGRHQ
jgi:hypothetical protein